METKKSLCCGADVTRIHFGNDWYKCGACGEGCDLQKNEDLTLAEVYTQIDDILEYQNQRNQLNRLLIIDERSSKERFDDVLFFPQEIFEDRYKVLDRKSWHKHEKKEEPSKEIKIGDKLTGEQATKYLKAGGFVEHENIVIYRLNKQNKLEYFGNYHNCWLPDSGDRDCFKADSQCYTAVENPEKQTESEVDRLKKDLADEQIKVKELNENCHGLKKEVEDLRRKNTLLTDSAKGINELVNKEVAEFQEREKTSSLIIDDLHREIENLNSTIALLKSDIKAERKKSEWLPYPENKPNFNNLDGRCLIKDFNNNYALVRYSAEKEEFLILGHTYLQVDKSTILFFREV